MNKGFTFQQLGIILLSLVILIALIIVFLTQKDQISTALSTIFGSGEKAAKGLEEVANQILP